MIILFENFINEKLGILNNLSDLADFIISKLKDTNYYQYTDNYKGTNIILNCFLVKKIKKFGAFFEIEDPNEKIFKIKTTTLNKSTIVHELKHLDYVLARKMKVNSNYFLSHVGRDVNNELGYLTNNTDLYI